MGKYIGKVDIIGSFYNFMPLIELEGHSISALSENDRTLLLPKSQLGNINLSYKPADEEMSKLMESTFPNGRLVVFEFELSDLEENYTATGLLNQTGYKCPGVDFINSGKIRSISTEGYYYLRNEDILDSKLDSGSSVITLSDKELAEGDKILIKMKGFNAGPYIVKLRAIDKKLYIRPEVRDRKYLLVGYKSSDCKREEIQISSDGWYDTESRYIYSIKKNAVPEVKDVLSKQMLLEYFINNIPEVKKGSLTDINIGKLIEEFDSSVFSGQLMTDEIRESRRNTLKELFTSHEYLDETFSNISKCIFELLVKYQNEEYVNTLLDTLLKEHPDFADKIQNVRILKEQVETTRSELLDLKNQKKSAETDLQTIKDQSRREEENQQKSTLNKEIEKKKEELEKLCEIIKTGKTVSEMNARIKDLSGEIEYRETHKRHLENDINDVEQRFNEVINRCSTRVADITIDGYVSSKMLEAAAQWNQTESKEKYRKIASSVGKIQPVDMEEEELLKYIVGCVKKFRPQYSSNAIINIAICTVQSFLTVFAGPPGCGKTSICNIMAKVLGLNRVSKAVNIENADRYVQVSVERGWTSKRDLIGYYNPLTKTFEESNHAVFDGLKILNEEYQGEMAALPFFILLDEANLSPMEYYWADFMNICDDIEDNNRINLGNDNILSVPETLHFVATINNDHTTETLSPRLIDRAWVITLPQGISPESGENLDETEIKMVSWKSLKEVFTRPSGEQILFSSEVNKIYEEVRNHLGRMDLNISPRVEYAIKRYWGVASKLMKGEEDETIDASIIALDYAVSQKILPKIMGSGDEYEEWIKEFIDMAKKDNLQNTAAILERIVKRGNRQLKYYQFFA